MVEEEKSSVGYKQRENTEEEEEEEEKWIRGAVELWPWITSFIISLVSLMLYAMID